MQAGDMPLARQQNEVPGAQLTSRQGLLLGVRFVPLTIGVLLILVNGGDATLALAALGLAIIATIWLIRDVALVAFTWVLYPLISVTGLDDVPLSMMGVNVGLNQVIVAATVGVIGLKFPSHARLMRFVGPPPGLATMTPLVALAGISAAAVIVLNLTSYPEQSATAAVRMLVNLLVFVYAFLATKNMAIFRIWQFVAIATALLVSASTISDYVASSLGILSIITAGAQRAAGVFDNPVTAANTLIIGIPAVLGALLARHRGWKRVLLLTCFAIIVGGMLATFTRRIVITALLFALVLVILDSSTQKRRLVRNTLSTVLMLAAILLSFGALDEETIDSRLKDIPGIGSMDISDSRAGSGRIGIWKAVIRGLEQNTVLDWIVGNGLATSINDVTRYAGIARGGHNTYLELLYDLGVIGLLLYVLFAAQIFRPLISAGSEDDLGRLCRLWGAFWIAYLLSVEMFGASVYRLECRPALFLILGGLHRLIVDRKMGTLRGESRSVSRVA